MAEAIIDRLVATAHVIEVKDDNYRKKQAPKKKISIENESHLS